MEIKQLEPSEHYAIYFKLFLEDHQQRNCQPYECETGHFGLINFSL